MIEASIFRNSAVIRGVFTKLTQLIPYEFDPPASNYEEAHLVFQDAPGGETVSWPLVGVSLFLPKDKMFPSLDEIEGANRGKLKVHALSGFSIGSYHEFLVIIQGDNHFSADGHKYYGFKMGSIEATFGLATPLAALLFSSLHRGKYFGEWYEIASLQIFGVDADEVKSAFICACAAYRDKFGILPVLFSLDDSFLFSGVDEDEENNIGEHELVTMPPIITNIEPLRFLYSGLLQRDDAAACIYYYRVLEYFSFFTNAREMKKLRHDDTISDADFPKRILDFITKDEKGPIFKLIISIVDDGMLASAASEKLIGNAAGNSLCEALYAFRNSIVHGKFSYGYALQSMSILDEDPKLPRWRLLLRDLAHRALDRYGSKKT